MSSGRDALTQRRDDALRDLVELERQVEAGEIPADAAARIRGDYEAAAADALAACEHAERGTAGSGTSRHWTRGTLLAYTIAAAIALVALIVVLPTAIGPRPSGGAVTGNDILQTATPAPPSPARPPGMPTPEGNGR